METADKIMEIAHEWEHRTGLELEFEIAKKIIQKDVNNYILVFDDHFKTKGAYVKKLKDIDNDLPIVNKALIEYFINNIPPEETINSCDYLIEFQKVVKITGLYKYAWFGKVESEKVETNDGKNTMKTTMTEGQQLKEKVLRVFASKDENAYGVYKVKAIDKIEKIANTPDKCFINNENIIGVKVPEHLDKQYYIEIAKDRISKFIESNDEVKITAEQQIIEVLNKNHPQFYNVLIDIKENTNVGYAALEKFIKIDVFKTYGKVNKILEYIEYFKVLFDKKSPKKPTLEKVISSEEIFKILENCSEFNDGQPKLIKGEGKKKDKITKSTVPTYKNLDFESALIKIWNVIPDTDISTYEKIRQEFELYDDVTIIDDSIDMSDLFILAVNETKNPSIISYCINNGSIQFLKVAKQLFNILEIRQGDIIRANEFDLKPCVKVVGKDKDGINIIGKSPDRTEWWLTKYEIIDRNYVKNNKLIVDEEQE